MSKENKILGNPGEGKQIPSLLRRATEDSLINRVIEGKDDATIPAPAVHRSIEDVILGRVPLAGERLTGVNGETLAFNHNNYLAIAGKDGYLRVFHFVEMKTGQVSFIKVAEEEQPAPVRSIAFNEDDFLAVAYESNSVRLFEFCQANNSVNNRNLLNYFDLKGKLKFEHADIKKLAFVKKHNFYVGFSDGTINKYIDKIPTGLASNDKIGCEATKMAFSPDGKYVAVHHDEEGGIVFKYPELEQIGSTYTGYRDVDAMAFVPGCNMFAMGWERWVRFYEFDADKKYVKQIDAAKVIRRDSGYVDELHTVKAIAFSPDGKYMAVGNPEHVKLFDVKFNERTE